MGRLKRHLMLALIPLVMLMVGLLWNSVSEFDFNPDPVGTPQVYTTFITGNATATPDPYFQPETRDNCLDHTIPTSGFFVFRIWTHEADKELFRVDLDGSNFCQLTDNTIADVQPAISPDGTRIAFVSFDDRLQPGIYIMNPDSSDRVLLTDSGSAYSFPKWSPDGQQIVFQATIDELFDLFVINVDGTHLENLTNDTAIDTMPAWSSNRKQIAFASDRTFDPNGTVQQRDSFELYLMNVESTDSRRITKNKSLDTSPRWSPDNERIVFVSEGELYIINTDGSNIRQITYSDDFYANSPIWLDGERIAFAAQRLSGSGTIEIISVQTLNQTHLFTNDLWITELDGWWPQ